MAYADGLDNPVWSALTTRHRPLALAHGAAARYPAEIARFAGLEELRPEAFSDLGDLVAPQVPVSLFTTAPVALPDGWELLRTRTIEQMVLDAPPPDRPAVDLLELDARDAPEMLALATLTEPGPFFERTVEMGRYLGIRAGGRLIAMAGERLQLDGATEISAVCTHPDFQGHGYARTLMAALIADAAEQGRRPFLHVKSENGAKRLYEKLGFAVSRVIHLTLIVSTETLPPARGRGGVVAPAPLQRPGACQRGR